MIDPYAIVKRLTGCDLISPKDGKQLIEAVDALLDEIGSKIWELAAERLEKSSKPSQQEDRWP